nr:MAG TPA: hypothetical protein [Caudoviricetes sp.]
MVAHLELMEILSLIIFRLVVLLMFLMLLQLNTEALDLLHHHQVRLVQMSLQLAL